MAGIVDIVNRGLTKLGERRIMSMDEQSKPAAEANSLYPIVRDAVMTEHLWGFALKRAWLPALADGPEFGFSRAYQLPDDCLRIVEAGPWPGPVMGSPLGGSTQAWVIEGRRLLTNLEPPLPLRYLARIEDPAYYPASFIEALACKLAVEMAEALTGSGGKREAAWKEYELALRLARRVNDIQLPPETVPDDSWMVSRYM